jgi:hypothetical protein
MENSASPPFSSTLQFPDKLLGCKLRFRFTQAGADTVRLTSKGAGSAKNGPVS